jgi:hypothetical protein
VEKFYTVNASMQVNNEAPRFGREVHVANERWVMGRARSVTSTCVRPVFMEGDMAVFRWIFHFEWLAVWDVHA